MSINPQGIAVALADMLSRTKEHLRFDEGLTAGLYNKEQLRSAIYLALGNLSELGIRSAASATAAIIDCELRERGVQ